MASKLDFSWIAGKVSYIIGMALFACGLTTLKNSLKKLMPGKITNFVQHNSRIILKGKNDSIMTIMQVKNEL